MGIIKKEGKSSIRVVVWDLKTRKSKTISIVTKSSLEKVVVTILKCMKGFK